jgi:hypothetical protein
MVDGFVGPRITLRPPLQVAAGRGACQHSCHLGR